MCAARECRRLLGWRIIALAFHPLAWCPKLRRRPTFVRLGGGQIPPVGQKAEASRTKKSEVRA
eukprot:4964518-Prymnesium_polylepis.1